MTDEAKNDYYQHGGRPCAPRNQGKILLRCTTCGHTEYTYPNKLARVAAAKCSGCGWPTLEPSKASRERAKDIHKARAGLGKTVGRKPRGGAKKHQGD